MSLSSEPDDAESPEVQAPPQQRRATPWLIVAAVAAGLLGLAMGLVMSSVGAR